jgi:hypothetical protein
MSRSASWLGICVVRPLDNHKMLVIIGLTMVYINVTLTIVTSSLNGSPSCAGFLLPRNNRLDHGWISTFCISDSLDYAV